MHVGCPFWSVLWRKVCTKGCAWQGHCWTYVGCYAWEDGAMSQRKSLSLPNPLVLIDENDKVMYNLHFLKNPIFCSNVLQALLVDALV